MKNKFLIISILVLILSGVSDESFADKKIKLHLGQTINVDDLKFTFSNVDDSRCPSDVTCVWAGQVNTIIHIENQIHSKTVDFMLTDSYTFFSPYEIILLDVSPYPISTEKSNDSIATLVMSSLDGTSSCEKYGVIKDGLCIKDTGFIRIDDSSFSKQSLQTGETIPPVGTFTTILVGSLGPILIVFFIIIYAVKKRNTRKSNDEKK